MNNVFFIADQHFFHARMLEIASRPFSSVEEMNEKMIEAHNSVVKPGDRVYHLGDFAWKFPDQIIPRLNGQNYLIRGNHDFRIRNVKKIEGFIWVKDTFKLKVGELHIWLSHYPHREWPNSFHGSFHLHGHVHGQLERYGRSMDVGVDAIGYSPISIEAVAKQLKAIDPKIHYERLYSEAS